MWLSATLRALPNRMPALRTPRSIIAALLFVASHASASEQLDISYYPISGDTPAQLLQAMQDNGPQADDGSRFHGYTRWNVRWNYQTNSRSNGCVLQRVDTQVNGSITLPEWTGEHTAEAKLRERWRNYSTLLREHEQGHYRFALDAAAEIRRQLAALPPQRSCEALVQQANQLGASLVELQRQREIAYDRDSNHGRNNGLEL